MSAIECGVRSAGSTAAVIQQRPLHVHTSTAWRRGLRSHVINVYRHVAKRDNATPSGDRAIQIELGRKRERAHFQDLDQLKPTSTPILTCAGTEPARLAPRSVRTRGSWKKRGTTKRWKQVKEWKPLKVDVTTNIDANHRKTKSVCYRRAALPYCGPYPRTDVRQSVRDTRVRGATRPLEKNRERESERQFIHERQKANPVVKCHVKAYCCFSYPNNTKTHSSPSFEK